MISMLFSLVTAIFLPGSLTSNATVNIYALPSFHGVISSSSRYDGGNLSVLWTLSDDHGF